VSAVRRRHWSVDPVPRPATMPRMSPGLARLRLAVLAAALFFLVWGVKLTVIADFGSDLPNWDQWDAEGVQTFLPYLRHRLHFLDLFAPHNEHRVACTRLLALGLLLVNGQWDSRVECVVNAALHAGVAVVIFLYGCRLIQRRWQGAWAVAVAAMIAPPIAWQNVLGGFHSQQIFLLAFSLAALALLLTAPTGSGRWWTGLACAATALFTMASGLLAAAVVVAVLAVRGPPREVWRRHGLTVAACLLVAGAGWLLRVRVPQDAPLAAHSAESFLVSAWHSLEWPAVFCAPLAVLLWTPWAWVTWRAWRRRDPLRPGQWVIAAAGLWVLLQIAATAYGRGAGGAWPASRYLDTVATGVLVNALALLVALSSDSFPGWRAWGRTAVAVAWAGVVGVGTWRHVTEVWRVELPVVGAQMDRRDANTAAYLATGNDRYLDGDIPYPGKNSFMERISYPEIRGILPASIRAPLQLSGRADPAGSFAAGAFAPGTPARVSPAWGSYTAAGAAARGVWRSAPLPAEPHGGYWQIDVTGGLGRRAGLSLQMVSAASGRPLASIAPADPDPAAWTRLYLPAPRQAVRLVARDASPFAWFGFGAPVEMASLSYWAMRLASAGWVMALIAGAAGGLLITPFSWLVTDDDPPRAAGGGPGK
jgi:hypothetical protein